MKHAQRLISGPMAYRDTMGRRMREGRTPHFRNRCRRHSVRIQTAPGEGRVFPMDWIETGGPRVQAPERRGFVGTQAMEKRIRDAYNDELKAL
jgi:hypothetical protein